MAEVLCVYREVKLLKETAAASKKTKSRKAVAIVSYDEKPGIQAIATTAPDLPPEPGVHLTLGRDYEYKRCGTVSLLAGIDLVSGAVHALVKDRHRSREFVEFLQLLDAAYPAHTAIKLILDNHSAHVSKETKAWLADRPAGRFEFTFTPKHGSWLNLVDGFFSKLARSVLRHIRVASKPLQRDPHDLRRVDDALGHHVAVLAVLRVVPIRVRVVFQDPPNHDRAVVAGIFGNLARRPRDRLSDDVDPVPLWSSLWPLSPSRTFAARRSATPPPGRMPSSTAARVACIASSTRSLRSLTSISVAPPTRITATPPASLASRSCSFSRS